MISSALAGSLRSCSWDCVGQHGGLVVRALLGGRAVYIAEPGEGADHDQSDHQRADHDLHQRVPRSDPSKTRGERAASAAPRKPRPPRDGAAPRT